MVMPPAAAVWGIMSWEEEEEEGAWLAIVEGGGEGVNGDGKGEQQGGWRARCQPRDSAKRGLDKIILIYRFFPPLFIDLDS